MTKHPIKTETHPVCGECGSSTWTPFKNESRTLVIKGGKEVTVHNLSGTRCSECGEVELNEKSHARYVAAGDKLIIDERERTAAQLKAARLKLRLTQRQASTITGGGHNAFSRYERGTTVPLQAVRHLFHLLSHHPELLQELPGVPDELLAKSYSEKRQAEDCA